MSTTYISPGTVEHSATQRYRQQLAEELDHKFTLETPSNKGERTKQRNSLAKQLASAEADGETLVERHESECNGLVSLEEKQQRTLLTDDAEASEKLETKINVTAKRVRALEAAVIDNEATVESLRGRLEALDNEIQEAEATDTAAHTINATTKEYLEIVDSIVDGLKRLPELHAALIPSDGTKVSEQCKRRADIFVQDFRQRVVDDLIRTRDHVWDLLLKRS